MALLSSSVAFHSAKITSARICSLAFQAHPLPQLKAEMTKTAPKLCLQHSSWCLASPQLHIQEEF